ncbi:MAG: PilZ domain-containing protein [Planctomycetes bacterium]|nr:PilZ domain-containing protein [Planctomycetota bacterium]
MSRPHQSRIALIEAACHGHEPIRLEVPAEDGVAGVADGEMLACVRNGVLVELLDREFEPDVFEKANRVRAHFGVLGRRFEFSTSVRESVELPATTGNRRGLHLAMPLVLRERARERRIGARLSVARHVRAQVVLQENGASAREIPGRLIDVSGGGLGIEVDLSAGSLVPSGAVFRTRADAPDSATDFEFIVQIAHVTPTSENTLHVGCAFVALDDAGSLHSGVRRLQDWIESRNAQADSSVSPAIHEDEHR